MAACDTPRACAGGLAARGVPRAVSLATTRYSPSVRTNTKNYCALGSVWSVWVRAGFPLPVFFPNPLYYKSCGSIRSVVRRPLCPNCLALAEQRTDREGLTKSSRNAAQSQNRCLLAFSKARAHPEQWCFVRSYSPKKQPPRPPPLLLRHLQQHLSAHLQRHGGHHRTAAAVDIISDVARVIDDEAPQ